MSSDIVPAQHLDKLRRFCEARLPPGFPVRVEIPLLPYDIGSDKIFFVPTSYREDPTRFPDL
ncbi:hypothetical protein COOONC_02861 [Cooperia oncophora]